MCRRRMRRPKVADSTGVELTGAGLLTRTLIVRRLLRRDVLAADEQHVGVLLPPTRRRRGGQRRPGASTAAWRSISTTPSRPR